MSKANIASFSRPFSVSAAACCWLLAAVVCVCFVLFHSDRRITNVRKLPGYENLGSMHVIRERH